MWSHEEKLIISIFRSEYRPKHQDPSEELPDKRIDWDKFLQQSSRHGLSGLIYSHSRQKGFQNILSLQIKTFLRKEYYKTLIRNMLLLKELKRVLSALQDKGINPLFIQGASLLLNEVYPSLGVRPLTDIDFVVEPSQQSIVRRILQDTGYSPLPHYPNLFSYNTVVLDVHTDIANVERIQARRYAVNISNSRLRQKARLQEGPWGKAYTLSGEDLIITSAAHLQKHSYSRLIWFMDIIAIIDYYGSQLDWQEVVARAGEFNLQKPLYFTLLFIQEVFSYQIPINLTDELLSKKLNMVEEKFLAGLLRGNKRERVGDLLYFFSIRKTGKKILFLSENIFPRREVMAQVFGFTNPFAVGFCYLIRFFQSLWYGLKILISITLGFKREA